jgi:hypothetical protein
VQVVPIQIPEQEPHHRPSVTEGESRFELRKDSRQLPGQLPVASSQLSVASFVILSEVAAATEPKDLRLSSLTTGY